MNLLLDTCTFLWIVANAPELTEKARTTFSDSNNQVYLSAVSSWEIAVKHALGKLPLPDTPDIFVPEQRKLHQIDSLPLDEASTFHLHQLPSIHRDPFDRMLVCQAIEPDLVILTPDPMIRQYPVRTLW